MGHSKHRLTGIIRQEIVRFRSPTNDCVRSVLYVTSLVEIQPAMIADPRTSRRFTRMEPRSDDWTTLILSFNKAVI